MHQPEPVGHETMSNTATVRNMADRRAVPIAIVCLATVLLAIGGCSNGSAPKAKEGGGEASSSTLQAPAGIATVPVMLPFPVDKAGHELTAEFWVPLNDNGRKLRPIYLGLRMLFTAGDPDGHVRFIRDGNPIMVKVDLRHIDGDKEESVILRVGDWVRTGPSPMDRHIVVRQLSDGVAKTEGARSGHSAQPYGTPDGMYYQMGLGSAGFLAPGRYRLQVQVLHDQPRFQGVPMFLTVRETEPAK